MAAKPPAEDLRAKDADRPADELIAKLFAALGVGFFVIMFVATIAGVIARYLALPGFEWSFEMAGMTFVWVTFLGIVVAELRGDNVAFEPLKAMALPFYRGLLETIASLCLLAVGVALVASGIAVLRQSAFVPTPVLRWPNGLLSGSVLVSGTASCVIAALRLRRQSQSHGRS